MCLQSSGSYQTPSFYYSIVFFLFTNMLMEVKVIIRPHGYGIIKDISVTLSNVLVYFYKKNNICITILAEILEN